MYLLLYIIGSVCAQHTINITYTDECGIASSCNFYGDANAQCCTFDNGLSGNKSDKFDRCLTKWQRNASSFWCYDDDCYGPQTGYVYDIDDGVATYYTWDCRTWFDKLINAIIWIFCLVFGISILGAAASKVRSGEEGGAKDNKFIRF